LESDWPNSQRVIDENFAGVPEDEKQKMIVVNAVKYFRLADQEAGKTAGDTKTLHTSH
jgi:hypothetical protein